ncbi:MAG: hypothetical protein R3F65_14775 [bacterium]
MRNRGCAFALDLRRVEVDDYRLPWERQEDAAHHVEDLTLPSAIAAPTPRCASA